MWVLNNGNASTSKTSYLESEIWVSTFVSYRETSKKISDGQSIQRHMSSAAEERYSDMNF